MSNDETTPGLIDPTEFVNRLGDHRNRLEAALKAAAVEFEAMAEHHKKGRQVTTHWIEIAAANCRKALDAKP
jgi:hypothetical protein